MISDPISGAASRPATSPDLLPADLPAWAPALPLWAGARWLWLSLALDGLLRYWCGGAVAERGQRDPAQRATGRPAVSVDRPRLRGGQLRPGPVDSTGRAAGRRGGAVRLRPPPEYPAGANSRHRRRTPPGHLACAGAGSGGLLALAPGTRPRSCHLLDANLQPPDTLRDWLHQVQRRWRPVRQVACLPVWRDTGGTVIALLNGALTPALLQQVAGHPVCEPLSFLHIGRRGRPAGPRTSCSWSRRGPGTPSRW